MRTTTLPIGMKNGSAFLERLGADVPQNQFIRELYKNAEDAGATKVDFDIDRFNYIGEQLYKLSIIDNGPGMDGDELIELINKFASGTNEMSLTGNFGIGAKISTFPNNPHGTIYLSRKDGINYQIHFEKDSVGTWGLRQFERPDGTYGYFTTVEDSVMPKLIMESGHGTAVVLLGKDREDNTLLPPKGVKGGKTNWIIKELNSRFFKIPSAMRLRVNQFTKLDKNAESSQWISIRGNGWFLDKFSKHRGTLEHPLGKIHYYVIKKNQQNQKRTGVYVTSGHTGIIYQNEIYDMRFKARGTRMLQNFGLNFSSKRVVIYIEPNESLGAVPNSGRTELVVNGNPFPWDDFADWFRENMPDEIGDLERKTAESSVSKVDYSSIDRNLKSIYNNFLKVSRYKPAENGDFKINNTDQVDGGESSISPSKDDEDDSEEKESNTGGDSGGTQGSIYEIFQTKNGSPAKQVNTTRFPDVYWVSTKDGTRDNEDGLEDRAAMYSSKTYVIKANADFRVFKDTDRQFQEAYKSQPGLKEVVSEIVRKWYTQELKEIIVVAEQLRNTKMWVGPCVDRLTSEEALTCAMLSKFNLIQQIDSEIQQKIKELKKAA